MRPKACAPSVKIPVIHQPIGYLPPNMVVWYCGHWPSPLIVVGMPKLVSSDLIADDADNQSAKPAGTGMLIVHGLPLGRYQLPPFWVKPAPLSIDVAVAVLGAYGFSADCCWVL